jgi:hypothetical protein
VPVFFSSREMATSVAPSSKRPAPPEPSVKKAHTNPYLDFCSEQRPQPPKGLGHAARETLLGQPAPLPPGSNSSSNVVPVVPMAVAVAPASYCSSPYCAPGQELRPLLPAGPHHGELGAQLFSQGSQQQQQPELQAQQQELQVKQEKQLEQQLQQLQQLQSPVKIQKAIPESEWAMRHVSPPGNPLVAGSAAGPVSGSAAPSTMALATGHVPAQAATPGGGKAGKWVTSPYHEFCQKHRPLLLAGLSNSGREKQLGQMWRVLPEAEKERYKASLTKLPTFGRGGMRAWVPANMAHTPPPPSAPAMSGTMFDRWDDLQQRHSNAEAAEQAAATAVYHASHQSYMAPTAVPFSGLAVLASRVRADAPLIGAAMVQVVQARCASRISAMSSARPATTPTSAPTSAPPPHSQGNRLFETNTATSTPVLTTRVGPFGTRRLATDVDASSSVASKRAAPAAPADAPPGKKPCTNPSGAPTSHRGFCGQAPASHAGGDYQQSYAPLLAAPLNTEFSSRAALALQQAHAEGLALQTSDNLSGFDNVFMLTGGSRPFQAQVTRGHKPVHLGNFATAQDTALCVARSPEVQVAADRTAAESYVRGIPVQPHAPIVAKGATRKEALRADQVYLVAPGLTRPCQKATCTPRPSEPWVLRRTTGSSEDQALAAMALAMLSDHRPNKPAEERAWMGMDHGQSSPPPHRPPPPQRPNQLAQRAASPPLSADLSGPELRRRCGEVGLPQYGTRAQIVARLHKHERVQRRTYEAAQLLAGRCPSPPQRSPPLEHPPPPQRPPPPPPMMYSGLQATRQVAAAEPTPFTWSECHNLISTDASGTPVCQVVIVRQPSAMAYPAVKLQVKLLLPLLYSAERRSWLWHKKWRLPKLQVQAHCNGKPAVGRGSWTANGQVLEEPPVYVVVSAGTLRDGSNGIGLYDKGLGGECQKRLILGEATFSSLLFQNTSFNCGGRPFHLVVTVLAPAHHPLAIAALANGEVAGPTGLAPLPEQMVVLATVCSSRIVVDARKRTTGERPDADASDVRLVRRPRGGGGFVLGSSPQSLKPQPRPPPPPHAPKMTRREHPEEERSESCPVPFYAAQKRKEHEAYEEEEEEEAEAEAEDEDEDEDEVGEKGGGSASEPYGAERRKHEREHNGKETTRVGDVVFTAEARVAAHQAAAKAPPVSSIESDAALLAMATTRATMLAAVSPNRSETVSQSRLCQLAFR